VRRTGWPYVGVALGGAVSVAANVAHSFVPPSGAASDWSPEPGSVVLSVFWPVALFVVVEIFARTVWPVGRRWVALRLAGLLPVALVAAVVSYRHLSGLLDHYGEDRLTAVLGPLAVDGLMVTASAALVAAGKLRELGAGAELRTAEDQQEQPGDRQDRDGDRSPEPEDREDRGEDEPDEDPAAPADPLLPAAREVASELEQAGRSLSRSALAAGLRARGQGVGTGRASALLAALREAREPVGV
jgi:hypothetical protein